MYGNVYDLTIALSHDGADGTTRRVRVLFGSLTTASISRFWDGFGLVDDPLTVLRHVPGSPVTTLAEVELTRAAPPPIGHGWRGWQSNYMIVPKPTTPYLRILTRIP
jgi:hypothetical protein